MFPIAYINTENAMRRSLIGSDARDPVLRYQEKRRRLRRRGTS
jgi:hypothetical protein